MNKIRLTLLPPKKGLCQECAVAHPETHPHNKNSLFYQYYFFNKNGRWPTWTDSMKHCDDKTRARWSKELIKRGAEL